MSTEDLRTALAEADRIMGHDDDATEWREKWAHLWGASSAAAVPLRNREADRQRFPDPAFNRWLDEGISDAGHTVWDQVGDVCAAWHGWWNREFYATPAPPQAVPATDARSLIEECRSALAEELSAWDIDPPLHHVKQAHDKCVAWLAAPTAPVAVQSDDSAGLLACVTCGAPEDWAAPVAVDAAAWVQQNVSGNPALMQAMVNHAVAVAVAVDAAPTDKQLLDLAMGYLMSWDGDNILRYARAVLALRAVGAGSREPLTDADSRRIDALDRWIASSKANGVAWCEMQFSTEQTARPQLDKLASDLAGIAARGKA